MAGGGSRELLAESLAKRGMKLIGKLDAIIVAGGEEPILDSKELEPALVLTIDELIPERIGNLLERPAVMLGLGVLSLGGQAAAVIATKRAGGAAAAAQQPKPQATPPTPAAAPAEPRPQPTPPQDQTPAQAPPPPAPAAPPLLDPSSGGYPDWDGQAF